MKIEDIDEQVIDLRIEEVLIDSWVDFDRDSHDCSGSIIKLEQGVKEAYLKRLDVREIRSDEYDKYVTCNHYENPFARAEEINEARKSMKELIFQHQGKQICSVFVVSEAGAMNPAQNEK